MRRAQISVDFIIVFSVIFIIFVILFQFSLKDRFSVSVEKQIQLSAREEAEQVAFVVQGLLLAGDGSNTTFYVSSDIAQSKNFTLVVYDEGFVVVDLGKEHTTVALFSKSVSQTILSPGKHTAFNINGVISFD